MHVGKFALFFMYAEVKQLCWDCGVKHKVAIEEPMQANRSNDSQQVSCVDKAKQ